MARNSLRFQGQQEDEETGLHYNRHRYYDPSSGRFVSKDPIGLDGGINVYQYADNPTGWIDPLGLAKRCGCPCGVEPHGSLSELLCVRHKLMAKEPRYATQTQGRSDD
ncbi:RHS repeat-associated core domain-containing protein [Burkholderia multivorans]|nr:RHS repeat-associated core domain-containing protein [Burkholderia multivorans]